MRPNFLTELLIEKADDFIKGPVLRVVARPVFGDGLLTSEGELHRQRRRLVAPALAHQRMAHYSDVIKDHTVALGDSWRDGQTFDVVEQMMRLTLGIVCRTLFDVEVPGQAEAIGHDILTAQTYAMRQIRVPFPLPKGKALAALARLDERIYGIIRERRASGGDRGDLLSMLLLARDEETGLQLDDKAVRDEAMTLFLGGAWKATALATGFSRYLAASAVFRAAAGGGFAVCAAGAEGIDAAVSAGVWVGAVGCAGYGDWRISDSRRGVGFCGAVVAASGSAIF